MLPYFDLINFSRWLSEKLGTTVTVPDLRRDWDDYDVQMYAHYFDVMEDPATQEAIRFHEQKRAGRGLRLVDGGKPDDAG